MCGILVIYSKKKTLNKKKCEKLTKLIYVSSDAVYKDTLKKIDENSICQSDNLHGVMHYTREQMLINSINAPISIVRPTLVYGSDDPHNGYGPNSFFRKAIRNQDIILFGKGEELRDHINIDEVTSEQRNNAKTVNFGIISIISPTTP